MGKRGIFIFLIIIMLMIPLISAAIPVQINVNQNKGLNVFYPKYDFVEKEDSFTLHLHTSNISDGKPMTNSEVDCYLHLYDITGNHTFESAVMGKNNNGWDHEQFISSGNFTTNGVHSFYIWCNATSVGGSASGVFNVNRLGEELDIAESILYIFISIAVILFFALSLFFMIITPYSHKINEKGEVIKITRLKYVKLGLMMLSYILLVWVFNTLIGISDSFLTLTIFYGFVSFIFITLNNLALPFGVFIIVLSLFEIIRDANIQKNINKLGSHRPSNLK